VFTLEKIDFFTEGEIEPEYTVGKVTMNKVSDRFTSKEQKRELKTYFVTFHDGARTRLHYHDSDQILIATEGEGMVEIVKKVESKNDGTYELIIQESTNFKKGETVLIPAGKIHWHGGISGQNGKFSHIAILKNCVTMWL
jgi:quercetin dioxygenase-like cupin family protein